MAFPSPARRPRRTKWNTDRKVLSPPSARAKSSQDSVLESLYMKRRHFGRTALEAEGALPPGNTPADAALRSLYSSAGSPPGSTAAWGSPSPSPSGSRTGFGGDSGAGFQSGDLWGSTGGGRMTMPSGGGSGRPGLGGAGVGDGSQRSLLSSRGGVGATDPAMDSGLGGDGSVGGGDSMARGSGAPLRTAGSMGSMFTAEYGDDDPGPASVFEVGAGMRHNRFQNARHFRTATGRAGAPGVGLSDTSSMISGEGVAFGITPGALARDAAGPPTRGLTALGPGVGVTEFGSTDSFDGTGPLGFGHGSAPGTAPSTAPGGPRGVSAGDSLVSAGGLGLGPMPTVGTNDSVLSQDYTGRDGGGSAGPLRSRGGYTRVGGQGGRLLSGTGSSGALMAHSPSLNLSPTGSLTAPSSTERPWLEFKTKEKQLEEAREAGEQLLHEREDMLKSVLADRFGMSLTTRASHPAAVEFLHRPNVRRGARTVAEVAEAIAADQAQWVQRMRELAAVMEAMGHPELVSRAAVLGPPPYTPANALARQFVFLGFAVDPSIAPDVTGTEQLFSASAVAGTIVEQETSRQERAKALRAELVAQGMSEEDADGFVSSDVVDTNRQRMRDPLGIEPSAAARPGRPDAVERAARAVASRLGSAPPGASRVAGASAEVAAALAADVAGGASIGTPLRPSRRPFSRHAVASEPEPVDGSDADDGVGGTNAALQLHRRPRGTPHTPIAMAAALTVGRPAPPSSPFAAASMPPLWTARPASSPAPARTGNRHVMPVGASPLAPPQPARLVPLARGAKEGQGGFGGGAAESSDAVAGLASGADSKRGPDAGSDDSDEEVVAATAAPARVPAASQGPRGMPVKAVEARPTAAVYVNSGMVNGAFANAGQAAEMILRLQDARERRMTALRQALRVEQLRLEDAAVEADAAAAAAAAVSDASVLEGDAFVTHGAVAARVLAASAGAHTRSGALLMSTGSPGASGGGVPPEVAPPGLRLQLEPILGWCEAARNVVDHGVGVDDSPLPNDDAYDATTVPWIRRQRKRHRDLERAKHRETAGVILTIGVTQHGVALVTFTITPLEGAPDVAPGYDASLGLEAELAERGVLSDWQLRAEAAQGRVDMGLDDFGRDEREAIETGRWVPPPTMAMELPMVAGSPGGAASMALGVGAMRGVRAKAPRTPATPSRFGTPLQSQSQALSPAASLTMSVSASASAPPQPLSPQQQQSVARARSSATTTISPDATARGSPSTHTPAGHEARTPVGIGNRKRKGKAPPPEAKPDLPDATLTAINEVAKVVGAQAARRHALSAAFTKVHPRLPELGFRRYKRLRETPEFAQAQALVESFVHKGSVDLSLCVRGGARVVLSSAITVAAAVAEEVATRVQRRAAMEHSAMVHPEGGPRLLRTMPAEAVTKHLLHRWDTAAGFVEREVVRLRDRWRRRNALAVALGEYGLDSIVPWVRPPAPDADVIQYSDDESDGDAEGAGPATDGQGTVAAAAAAAGGAPNGGDDGAAQRRRRHGEEHPVLRGVSSDMARRWIQLGGDCFHSFFNCHIVEVADAVDAVLFEREFFSDGDGDDLL